MTVETALRDRPLRIALIGNPNTGKSTLFTALTGTFTATGNYPGVTVDLKHGTTHLNGAALEVIDLPGTYSLSPRSPDELLTVDVLLGHRAEVGAIDAVACVADATKLERNLYLLSQLRELQLPLVLVLTHWDRVAASGLSIDVAALETRLGVPVVTCDSRRNVDLDRVRTAMAHAVVGAAAPSIFPEHFTATAHEVQQRAGEWGLGTIEPYLAERLLFDVGGSLEERAVAAGGARVRTELEQLRQRVKDAGLRIPGAEAKLRYAWVEQQLAGAVVHGARKGLTASDRLDQWLTHWLTGGLAFAVLMLVIFQALFSWSQAPAGWIEAAFAWLGDVVQGVTGPGMLRSLLVDGVVAGLGGVLVFLPQIALMFLFLSLLEDCGYMARAALLTDRPMRTLGLSGKSFLPLMSSFACAIPGVLATRTIENRVDRLTTLLVAPLMSCSARLPVYALMLACFIPEQTAFAGFSVRTVIMTIMMSLGLLVAAPIAWLLRTLWLRGTPPAFVLELPPYHWPAVGNVLRKTWEQVEHFLHEATTLILASSIVIWALAYFPTDHRLQVELQRKVEAGSATDEDITQLQQEQARNLEQSYLGLTGRSLDPVWAPLGWDWRLGVGALASFPAREVIVSTLGTIFSLGGEVAEDDQGLLTALQQAKDGNGQPLYGPATGLSVMVFFALCAQCASTLAVIRRETKSWFWPTFTFGYMTALAYAGGCVAYRLGLWLWPGA